ncbi:MAG: 4-hydroxy-tetrahydrodipicolinate reductase [Chlamydiae bacterium]|nr:4-hydroxy-tetrahydrodipicolinate reductase [Chlamydiota bacterium]
MKIALIGFGKMGRMVERCALSKGHEIVARFTSLERPLEQIEQADVSIDFTQPSAVLETLRALAPFKKPVVIGTTGWDVEGARPYAEEMAILHAPNFSLGAALFELLLKKAHDLFSPSYDISGVEIHHSEKKDLPSGTALHLAKQIPGLSFQSVRSGSDPGTHQVTFDSSDDSIELTHRAHSREGFAKGAIEAASWLIGKVGFYTLDDYIEEKLHARNLYSTNHPI